MSVFFYPLFNGPNFATIQKKAESQCIIGMLTASVLCVDSQCIICWQPVYYML